MQFTTLVAYLNRNKDQYEQYWFPTPENPGDETTHNPIQQRILREIRNLQDLEQLNPRDDAESAESFSAILTGKTQCYNSVRIDK